MSTQPLPDSYERSSTASLPTSTCMPPFAQLAGDEPLSSDTTVQHGYISKDLAGVLFQNESSPRKQWLYNSGAIAFRSGDYRIHLSTKERSSNPDTRKREPIARHEPPLLFDLEEDVSE